MTMTKHFRSVLNTPFTAKKGKRFTVLGWFLLLVSFVIVAYQNTAMMSVYWVSYLALNIFIVALINASCSSTQ
ncbi:DUF3325 family protein [Pseudoalteromonas sp. C2R02]|uniref:DUF3325 family protein n=1 Tax=Pseudoalteromonas sp. C2R02 TaxID=2841565 RepID=UPI002090CD57|nr:DUF3325 family protein [Pseudoalteromonas sp. C2R02]